MPPKKRGKGKKTKRAAPASDANQQAGDGEEEAGDEGAAKRAKTWADGDGLANSTSKAQEEALKRKPKTLALMFMAVDEEEWLDGLEGVREGRSMEVSMGAGWSGTVCYPSKPDGKGEKVELEWRVVREGETEGDAAALGKRSRPVAALPSSSSSSSSSLTSSSAAAPAALSAGSSPYAMPMTGGLLGGGLRLQLRHRRLESEEKEGDEFVPYPPAGSEEEARLMRKREKKAKKGHAKKIQELEEAIENNRMEFERLTTDQAALPEDLLTIARERQYLKGQLQEFTTEDVEARYELRGEDVWYEVGLGCSVLLEELPGRPRAVWSVEGGRCGCLRSAWQSTHSVPYAEGRSLGEVDVSRLEYEQSIGSRGEGEGQFQNVSGIAADEEHIYVADSGKHCISVFHRSDGTYVRSWGSRGGGNLQFNGPKFVAVDGTHVYVADNGNNRVQVFTKAGVYVRSVGSRVEGEDGRLNGPAGVAVDGEHLVVSSWHGHYISVFEKGSGRFVRRFGSQGTGQGQFDYPFGLALDGDHVYIADYSNRVQVLTKGGVFVRMIGGGRGSGPGQLQRPFGVAVDAEHVFVCDINNSRIQIFNKADGAYVREVRRGAEDGLDAVKPYAIALHGERVYVTDVKNKRALAFRS